jgi:hypothetical protein
MSEKDPVPTPPYEGTPQSTPAASTEAKRPERKRRWWLRVLIALPILLIVLVLLAPTLLSLGVVRGMIVPSLQKSVAPNGKLEIKDWSLAWFGGQRIEGITLLDDQNAAVAHLNIKTGASIWGLIRGNYALGDTTVDGDFDVRIDPVTGRMNVLHILGSDPAAPTPAEPESAEPAKAPAPSPKAPAPAKTSEPLPIDLASVKGRLTVNMHGTIASTNGDRAAIPLTNISTGNLVVDLNDLEHGVGIDGTLKMTVNDKPATLSIKGTADAIENNVVIDDPNKISANLVATIEQLDLTIVKAALAAARQNDVDVAGLLKGKLVVDVKPGGTALIRSEDGLGIDNLVVTAPALKGDTFTSKRVDFPIALTRVQGADSVTIESLGLRSDVAIIDVKGTISQVAIQNLINQRPPGTSSSVTVMTDVPSFAALATMLPNTIGLQKNVTITGGGLTNTVTVELLADAVNVNQSMQLAIAGTADGKPIKLDKMNVVASAAVGLKAGLTPAVSDVRAFTLTVAAPFATINGEGIPEQMKIAGNVDLTRFYEDVSQFVDMGGLDLKGKAEFGLATAGLPKDGGEAFGAKLGFKAVGLVVTSAGHAYLNNENVNGDVDLLLKQAGDMQTVTFRKLKVGTDSGLFGLWTAGDNAWLSVRGGVPIAGDGEFHLAGKLECLVAPFAAAVDPSMKLTSGQLDSVITFSFDENSKQYDVKSDVALTKLNVGQILANESLEFGTTSHIPADLASLTTDFEVASSFVNAKGDAVVLLKQAGKETLTPFEMAKSVNFRGGVPSLPKLYALAHSMSPSVAPAAGEVALPPLKVNGGNVSFDGSVKRDEAKGVTSVTLNVPGVNDLALSRGAERFVQGQPITLALVADVTTDSTKATITEQLKRVLVSKLDANIPGIARLTMPQAIELTNLDQPTPTANGVVQADGNLQPLGEFLGVVNGSNPLPVSGTFSTKQKVGTSGDSISLVGGMTLNALRPLGKDAQPLPENLQTVELADDLSADLKAKSATIKRFELSAPRAKDVLGFTASGTIRDLGTKNSFDGMSATLAYDLPQLWPLAQPFVDPTGESIGKIEKLAGKYQKKFTIAGSYPTVDKNGKPILFNNSIRSLDVHGDLQIDNAYLADKGVEVANLSIPILLKGGVAKIANADGSLPKDFDVNSGKGKLGGITVDLTAAEPMIAKLDRHPLITNATLNPIMSNALGKFFNPIFPNATKAKALVTVNVSADHLLLGKSLTTKDSGKGTVVLTLTDMEISNPLGEQLLGGLFNQASGALKLGGGLDTKEFSNFRGEMKNATFTLNRGVVTQNATFMLGSVEDPTDKKAKPKTLYPFTFGGDVRLSDLAMNLDAGLPMGLVRDKVKGGDIAKILEYMPDQLPIGFGGTTTTPKLNFNDAGKTFSEAIFKYGASRLTGDKGDGKSGDKVEDIIGGLLGGKDKEKDREKSTEPDRKATPDDSKKPEADEEKMTKAEKRRAEEKRKADEQRQAEEDAKKKKKK